MADAFEGCLCTKQHLPFLGVIALVLAVLLAGVSALAAWREHHGHAESGFVIVSHLRSHVLSERASAPACPKENRRLGLWKAIPADVSGVVYPS